jgi:hypothetical protein
MNIFILMGETGEYSDHTTWFVAAYTTREMAELHQKQLMDIVKDVHFEDRNEIINKAKELDPICHIDYTGVSYDIYEEKLCRHIDEFLEQA